MSAEKTVCTYNTEPDFSAALTQRLAAIPGVQVATGASDRATLLDVLQRLPIQILVINLDPHPKVVLEIMEAVVTAMPELAIVALSEDSSSDTILAAMRAGCRQFVAKPLAGNELAQALGRISVAPAGGRIGPRFAIMGASGGAGTTTIACNLAIELARLTDRKAAVVDLHLDFGDVCTMLDCNPRNTLADLCGSDTEIDADMVSATMCNLPCNVALLGRPTSVDQAANVSPEKIHRTLEILATLYSAVVIDTPRRLDPVVLGTLEQTNAVVLVLQLSVPSIRNAIRCRQALLSLGMPKEEIHLVVNRYESRRDTLTPKDVANQIGQEVFALVPNDYEAVSSAMNLGHTLATDAPDSPVNQAIAKMAQRLLKPGSDGAGEADTKRRGGLFGRLFSSSVA